MTDENTQDPADPTPDRKVAGDVENQDDAQVTSDPGPDPTPIPFDLETDEPSVVIDPEPEDAAEPRPEEDVPALSADAGDVAVPDAATPDAAVEAPSEADAPTMTEDGGGDPATEAVPVSRSEGDAPSEIDGDGDALAAAAAGTATKQVRRKPKDPAVARAHRTKMPIEGTIVGVIKGGYEVRLGKSRAFCPHSQIDSVRVEEPESFVDRTLTFLVTQYRRGGDDVVVSRRALIEEERAEEAKAVRATLIEGAVTQGHVVGVAPFGAFVDLGAGVQGLVHISELSHRRVLTVEEAVKVGDTVQVKVLRMEKDARRISLSVRRAEKDPWAGVGERFAVGSVHPGTVVRLAEFGAFVEMEPSIEALAPAREIPPTSADWKDGLEPGSSKSWRVLSVDRKRRRMSVVPDIEGVPTAPIELVAGSTVEGRVQRIERFGVFVWLAPGQVGLMPAPLSGIPQGTRLDSRYRPGDAVQVQIVDIEQDGARIRLAAEGVDANAIASDGARGQERAPRRAEVSRDSRSTSSSPESTGTFGSSLGDALRAALGTADKNRD